MPARSLRKPVRLPPKDLSALRLSPVTLRPVGWYRLSWPGRELTFSKNDEHRFSPEDGRYEVIYFAEDPFTAALEVFGARLYKRSVRIPLNEWHKKVMCSVELPSVSVADLTYSAMAQAKVTLGSLASCSRNVTHKWARAVMDHPAGYHGLLYLSDYTAKPCLALFNVSGDPKPRMIESQIFGLLPVANQLLRDYKVTLL
jgi:hypothetical protein